MLRLDRPPVLPLPSGAMRRLIVPSVSLWLLLPAACSTEPSSRPPEGPADTVPTGSRTGGDGSAFERNVVFLAAESDSLLVVPWLFTAVNGSRGVDRAVRGLILRGTAWEPFFDEAWVDPPTPVPWRILPHDGLGLVVGQDDALERILFADGPRQLELALEGPLTEWSGPRGGTYRLLDGALVLGGRRVDGLVLDMSRSLDPGDRPPGDWALLASGDSLQAVLLDPVAAPPGSGAWRGWARLDFRDLRWPALTVEWPETRAFERARRDVPVAWRVTSGDGEVTVELTASGAHLETGEGPGAQLPVSGLFGVTGTLAVEGGTYPVRGLLRHVQR